MHPLNIQSLFLQGVLGEILVLSNYLHTMAVTMKSSDRVLELTDFPDEIILKFFACLDLKDLLKCGQVAKRFRSISHDQSLWQRIDLSGQNIPTVFIQFILERGCKYLDLSHSRMFDLKSTQNIFNNCDQLTELNLEDLNISVKESFFLVQNLTPKLKKINLGALFFKDPDEHIKILVERCNQLQELHMECAVPITDSVITMIIEGLKNTLQVLDLYPCEEISHPKLLELQVMPKLTILNIRYIRKRKYIRRRKIGPLRNSSGFGFVLL